MSRFVKIDSCPDEPSADFYDLFSHLVARTLLTTLVLKLRNYSKDIAFRVVTE